MTKRMLHWTFNGSGYPLRYLAQNAATTVRSIPWGDGEH
jgi:hypothetical protein